MSFKIRLLVKNETDNNSGIMEAKLAKKSSSKNNKEIFLSRCLSLNHLFSMQTFSTPWKHQKTASFSDVFRGRERMHWKCAQNKWVKKVTIRDWIHQQNDAYTSNEHYIAIYGKISMTNIWKTYFRSNINLNINYPLDGDHVIAY